VSTGNNEVTLSDGDSASVMETDKAVYIGADAGSNDNQLTIGGALTAFEVFVGSDDNSGNELAFEATCCRDSCVSHEALLL